MPIATHTLTGDLLPVLGGVEWDSVTAWLECEPFADFVQDPGTGTLMPDRRLPFDVAADGSFSVVVPDSAQAGLSYRLNAQPSLAGRRLAGKRSDPFTVALVGPLGRDAVHPAGHPGGRQVGGADRCCSGGTAG